MNHRRDIDVLMLVRPGHAPRTDIVRAIAHQSGVRVRLFVQVGQPLPGDRSRWSTIARARNAAKSLGSAPLVAFVDDDVLLDENCLLQLANELAAEPALGAVAADYEQDQERPGRRGHVGMGATLFRRSVLEQLTFRSTDKLCECWCVCFDLRSRGMEIRYSPVAKATHLRRARHSQPLPRAVTRAEAEQLSTRPPRILAAFDRRDIQRFEGQFLRTLRASGNHETVTAIAYGLYPSEQARLSTIRGVQWDFQSYNGHMVPIRRLYDFARHLADEDSCTPVAYWDVADVVFQDSLSDLWTDVRATPGLVRAVVEPKSYPENKVIAPWCLSIRHPGYRQQAFQLLKRRPFLNSGFAAGTADAMLHYFRRAHSMRHGPELSGSTDWGDQMCLNLYCHMHPGKWQPIDQRWNYCVHDRIAGEVVVGAHGRVYSRRGQQIAAAHGNARSLRQLAIVMGKH